MLLLENIAQLPADVLSSLNDTVRLVMQAVRSSSTESIRIGRGPAVRVSTQPVCVVSHTSIHHEPTSSTTCGNAFWILRLVRERST